MGYRSYNEADNAKYEDSMKELRNAWALETEKSPEEKEMTEEFEKKFS